MLGMSRGGVHVPAINVNITMQKAVHDILTAVTASVQYVEGALSTVEPLYMLPPGRCYISNF